MKIVPGLMGIAVIGLFAPAIPAAARAGSLAPPVVGRAVGFGESAPARELAKRRASGKAKAGTSASKTLRAPEEAFEASFSPQPDREAPPQRDEALQAPRAEAVPLPIPAPSLTFEGLSAADNVAAFGISLAPSDSNGAVGPNDYVETTNTLVRVYDKNGNPRAPAFKMSDLFASVGGLCASHDNGDPIVLYDRMASRWLISQFAFANSVAPPYHQCIAVSKNGDPTGGYWAYDFTLPGNSFPNEPKFGVWPDGYYYSDAQYTNALTFNSFGAFAFDRAKMLVGDPTATFIYFNLGSPLPLLSNSSPIMLPASFNGLTPPPAGAPNVFAVFTDDAFTGDAADALRLFDFHADFDVPPSSTFTQRSESPLAVAAFDSRNPSGRSDIEQPAPATAAADSLDSLGDRLMLRLQYLNRGGTESLLVTHTVNAGTIPAPGILPTRAQYKGGVRYYELRKTTPGGAYSVNEQATFSPDANERWLPSAMMDNAGNIAVAYSLTSTSVFPSLAYAGRLAGDAPNGLFQGEATLFSGTGSQLGTGNRWGDYASLSLDPSDDATFWYVNQYYATNAALGFDWHTRIGKFKFAGTSAPAQGTLSGTVTACDTGLPMPDVVVTAVNGPSDGFSATTGPDGTYAMNLAPGDYSVYFADPAHDCIGTDPAPATITDGGTVTRDACMTGIPKFSLTSETVSGGNGDATIDADECANIDVTIRNIGCLVAPDVTAVLSTSTPNVTVTQPNTSFPSIDENADGPAQFPFTVAVSPAFVCGTPIAFTLTITSPAGGSTALPFVLPTCVTAPITVNGSLDGSDLQQTARLGRNGLASACGTAKTFPGILGTGNRSYDLYTFTNGPTAACVTIETTVTCSESTNAIMPVAYLGSFNPANIATNYRGDPGESPDTKVAFSVDVPANATLLVNVHEVDPATGCSGYSVKVSGLVGNTDGGGICAKPSPATIAKAFGAAQVTLGAPISVTFTVTNPNPTVLSGIAFSDPLPAGLVVANPNAAANTCGGTFTADPGSGSITLSGGILAPNASCTVSANVTGTTLGPKDNTTSVVTSIGGTGSASNTATVTILAPPAQVPALGGSGLLLLAGLLVLAGGFMLRSR